MRLLLTLIVLTTNYFVAYCQNDSTKVAFVSYWSIGDSYNFKITKVKQQWKNGLLTKNDSTQYTANFKVVDSTANSYKIKWSYENDLKNTYKIPENLLEKFSKFKLTEVVYTTTELGEFVGVENWEEIGEIMNRLFSDLIDVLGEEENQSKYKLRKAMQPIISVYNSKQGIEQFVLKELLYFHFPFGLEYDITEPIEYEEQLPNMFGGSPLKGDVKLFFESVDFDNNHCVLIQQMKLNPDDTKAIVLQLFKKMGLKDKEMKKAFKTAKFDIIDDNRFEYYYYPGVPIKIETKRESVIDIDKEKGKSIEKTIIELIE